MRENHMKKSLFSSVLFLALLSNAFAGSTQTIICSKKSSEAPSGEFYKVTVEITDDNGKKEYLMTMAGNYYTPGLYSSQQYEASSQSEYSHFKVEENFTVGNTIGTLLSASATNPSADDDAGFMIFIPTTILGKGASKGSFALKASSEMGNIQDPRFKADLVHNLSELLNCSSFVKAN
jgi:hypothetical protein